MLVIYISLIYKERYILKTGGGVKMKKLIKVLTAAILSVAFVGAAAGAQAQSTCESIVITNTGENSNNQGVCTVVTNVTLVCNNNVYVLTENDQEAITGEAEVLGNTTGGTAITGNATNENGQTVTIGSSCGEATPAPSASPVTPAGGSGNVTPPAAKPAALPYTAGNSTLAIVVSSLVAAAAVVAGSRVAVAAYRRFSAK